MDEEVSLWMWLADASLQMAKERVNIEHGHVTVFRCHHAVESALKGLWAHESSSEFLRTTVLERLAEGTSLPQLFHQFLPELSPEAAASRHVEVIECLAKTQEVITWIEQRLHMDQDTVIKQFVKRVAKAVQPEAILLFGSRARGDHREESDYDFIVIASSFASLDRGKRYALLRPLAGYGHGGGVDILSFTPDEFSKAIPRSFILRDALKYAKVLHGTLPQEREVNRAA